MADYKHSCPECGKRWTRKVSEDNRHQAPFQFVCPGCFSKRTHEPKDAHQKKEYYDTVELANPSVSAASPSVSV